MVMTGRKVAAIFVGAFGVIIAVNVLLAVQAVRTFPGLEVSNSYVASQGFDAGMKAQKALGWTSAVSYDRGELRLVLTGPDGRPVEAASLNSLVARPTEALEDKVPNLTFDGTAYAAPLVLASGVWEVRVNAVAEDGTPFTQRLRLRVPG